MDKKVVTDQRTKKSGRRRTEQVRPRLQALTLLKDHRVPLSLNSLAGNPQTVIIFS